MKKIFLFIFCNMLMFSALQASIYYSGAQAKQYDYEPYYTNETIVENNIPSTYNTKRTGYSIRLVLSGYDDIVLELTSNENINNEVYLLFEGGVLKQMKKYSNNIYYYVFDNYRDIETLVFLNDKNIPIDKNLKTQIQSDYNYMIGIINNRYYRDRYYRDYNFQYKR